MKKNSSLQKKFEELLSQEEALNLDLYKDANSWKLMSRNERELLALLFIKQGEQQLKNGDSEAMESFEFAERAAPKNPTIRFREAIVFMQYKENVSCMLSACRSFQKALKLKPDYFDALYGWGTALMQLGMIQTDSQYLQDADLKFIEAEKVSAGQPPRSIATMFLHWGVALYHQGRASGEAIDFSAAIDKFSQSAQLGLNEALLFMFYGDAVTELSYLINKREMLFEAGELYLKALDAEASPEELHDAWHNLGCCYERIFDLFPKKDYFDIADDALKHALDMEPKDFVAWDRWGQLYANAGRILRNVDFLHASIEKFAKADQYEPNSPHILSRLGEALMLCGSHMDRVDMIRDGEEKIRRSLELDPNATRLWYLYGSCSNELGWYFKDAVFFYQAIEKFQYGLSLNQSDPLLWNGLGLSHFALGEIKHDAEMVEKAITYYSRALEFGCHIFPQFWNDWGVALMRLADFKNNRGYIEAAIEKFEMAVFRLGEDPAGENADPEWLYNYGCALDFLGDLAVDSTYYEKAVQILVKVLQIDPIFPNARYNLGVALSHLGEATSDIDCLLRAIDQFNIILSHDGEDEASYHDLGLAHMYLAELLYDPVCPGESQKHFELAEAKLLHALALGHLSAYYHLACLQALLQNFDMAIHFLEKAETARALPDFDDLMHDEWLEGVRETPHFKKFISQTFKRDV